MHEKLENNDLAFQVYYKIVNCDGGRNSNLDYVAASYFEMAKLHHGRNEYVNSRELFVKFFICMKKLYDRKRQPALNREHFDVGKMIEDSASMLLATGEENDVNCKICYFMVINSFMFFQVACLQKLMI